MFNSIYMINLMSVLALFLLLVSIATIILLIKIYLSIPSEIDETSTPDFDSHTRHGDLARLFPYVRELKKANIDKKRR